MSMVMAPNSLDDRLDTGQFTVLSETLSRGNSIDQRLCMIPVWYGLGLGPAPVHDPCTVTALGLPNGTVFLFTVRIRVRDRDRVRRTA